MTNRHSAAAIATGIVVGLALTSCGDGAGTPPVVPTAGTPLRVEMSAPDLIPPGQSVQLTAIVFRNDGTSENVTRQAQWTSSNTGIVRVAADGMATALISGEVSISVRYQGRNASKRVLAVPAGTFKLNGTVTESGSPVGGVRLAVVSGVGSGLTAATTDQGSFVLYGVGGVIGIELTKSGYVRKLEELAVNENARHDMTIVAERQRRDLRGTYSLSITADCGSVRRGVLPDAARERTYSAAVAQTGPILMVELAGDFRLKRFGGVVEPNDDVRFKVTNEDFYYDDLPAIAEVLGPGEELIIGGLVNATAMSTTIEGTLAGYISVSNRVISLFSSCEGNHRFVMVRQ